MLWVWNRRLHYLTSLSSYFSAAILRFLFIFRSMVTSSIGANVWHSWHSMHKRNGETEEDSRALSLFAASGTHFTSSCWHVFSGKNSSCNSGLSSLFGTARGSRPSHTTVVHIRLRCQSTTELLCQSVQGGACICPRKFLSSLEASRIITGKTWLILRL